MVGSALIRSIPKTYELITASREELDLNQHKEVASFFKENSVDAVILAAALVGGIGANTYSHKEFLVENLMIQNGVLLGASEANVPNFVFLGSSCIYPKLAAQPIKESSILSGRLEPSNEGYALAKISGVRLAQAIYEQNNLNYFSLMPTNLYGPNDNFDLHKGHVPAALMRKFHEAKLNNDPKVIVWGTGTPRREFMHVDDLARACWHMLGQNVGGELINIGTGSDISISDFAKLMAGVVGYNGSIEFDTSKLDGTPRKLLDVTKAKSYGWEYQVQLRQGLESTYEWFVEALEKGEVRGI